MSDFLGSGVSRTLTAKGQQFLNVVWRKGKPPLDSEFNLLNQVLDDARQNLLTSRIPSGWVSNVYSPMSDYEFDRQASNLFWLGKTVSDTDGDILWANVNGWMIPVVGTQSSDTRNAIKLPPPQGSATESDVNFVFLEVWKAQISASGTTHKPTADRVYKYGNVEYGGTNPLHEMIDPTILLETTQRVQLQYRIRVVQGVNPALHPNGFNSGIKAQGALDNPTVSTNPSFQFQNMKDELDDAGLWRAGDGDGENGILKTVDGYTYAIPICMVFRRTNLSWNFIQQHGAVNRNPSMSDRSEATVLPTIKLTADIDHDAMVLNVDTAQNVTTMPASGILRVNGEIMTYTSYSGSTITLSERGSKGTHTTAHSEDDVVDFVSDHPLGYFSDQIVHDDVLDLRHIIADNLDYDSILNKNFNALLRGDLTTTWKRSHASLKGRRHFAVDYFGTSVSAPDFTLKAEIPDGFRKVFSDASALQASNLVVLGDGANSSTTDLTLNPAATMFRRVANEWHPNDVVVMGLNQFRNSIPLPSPLNQQVRFVHPFEYDNSTYKPFRVWFGDTDPDNGAFGKQTALTTTSLDSNPWFVVLGTQVEDLSVASNGQNDITFTQNVAGDLVDIDGITFTAQDGADLVAQGAWILITAGTDPTSTNPANHGAMKIIGVSGGSLVVLNAAGASEFVTNGTNNRTWSLRLTSCLETDTDVAVAFHNIFPAVDVRAYMTYDLLYHPTRGLNRVPDEGLYVELDAGVDANYVRENDFHNIVSSPNAAVKKTRAVSLATYPHQHHKAFQTKDPKSPATTTESVWTEAYVDRGSKTLVYQPLRNISARYNLTENPGSFSYADVTNEFDLTPSAADSSLLIPKELKPAMGRIDIPFVASKALVSPSSTAPAYGLNCMLLSGSANVNEGFVKQKMVAVYDPQNTTVGDFGNYTNLQLIGAGPDVDALVCRYYDRGGVRGIEIPAHYGIARLFAIYHQEDFYTVSAGTSNFSEASGFRGDSGVDRPNILRTDAERRSLIITDDNTFVIPEDVFDQTYFTDELSEQAIVFEFAAFFFDAWDRDLMRIHKLQGSTPTESLQMFVNGPSAAGDTFYAVSTRVPYQGGIYGTMPLSTFDEASVDYSDYTPKKSPEIPVDIQDLLANFANEEEIRTPNSSTLEVLSALPFATTLGTGVISGAVVPGSYTDTGYLSMEGYPFGSIFDSQRSTKTRVHPHIGNEVFAPVLSDTFAGLSERLPLGLITADYQFLGEGMGPEYKRVWTPTLSSEALDSYFNDRRNSSLGDSLVFSDGTSGLEYEASHNLYRTYRGGSVMIGAGVSKQGGPFITTGGRTYKDLPYVSNPDSKNLQIHGAVLFGIAFLVRNKKDVVTTSNINASFGDEIQMLVVTGVTLGRELPLTGNVIKEFADLLIQIHPYGAGEGYCAADRYLVSGRPLQKTTRRLTEATPVGTRDPSGPVAPPVIDPCSSP